MGLAIYIVDFTVYCSHTIHKRSKFWKLSFPTQIFAANGLGFWSKIKWLLSLPYANSLPVMSINLTIFSSEALSCGVWDEAKMHPKSYIPELQQRSFERFDNYPDNFLFSVWQRAHIQLPFLQICSCLNWWLIDHWLGRWWWTQELHERQQCPLPCNLQHSAASKHRSCGHPMFSQVLFNPPNHYLCGILYDTMKFLEACDVEFNQTCWWWWWCPFWSHLSGGYFPAVCCYLCLKSSNDCSSSSSAQLTKEPDLHVTEGRRSSPQKTLTVLAYHNDAENKSWDNMMHSWSWLTHFPSHDSFLHQLPCPSSSSYCSYIFVQILNCCVAQSLRNPYLHM